MLKNRFCNDVNYHDIWNKIMFNFISFCVAIGNWQLWCVYVILHFASLTKVYSN